MDTTTHGSYLDFSQKFSSENLFIFSVLRNFFRASADRRNFLHFQITEEKLMF